MPDSSAVRSMFGRIARRYDLANRLLSGGMDVGWRRRLVAAVVRAAPPPSQGSPSSLEIVDLATGSGDVAFALARALPQARILGLDFCPPMLAEAEAKKAAAGPGRYDRVSFAAGDGLALPLADASCDAITLAFGLRNMADRDRCLQEARRALRPDGTLFVLEFSQPARGFAPVYFFYLERILPRLAGRVTGDREAYDYLNRTIREFPGRAALAEEMKRAGFATVASSALTLGIVALHQARK